MARHLRPAVATHLIEKRFGRRRATKIGRLNLANCINAAFRQERLKNQTTGRIIDRQRIAKRQWIYRKIGAAIPSHQSWTSIRPDRHAAAHGMTLRQSFHMLRCDFHRIDTLQRTYADAERCRPKIVKSADRVLLCKPFLHETLHIAMRCRSACSCPLRNFTQWKLVFGIGQNFQKPCCN